MDNFISSPSSPRKHRKNSSIEYQYTLRGGQSSSISKSRTPRRMEKRSVGDLREEARQLKSLTTKPSSLRSTSSSRPTTPSSFNETPRSSVDLSGSYFPDNSLRMESELISFPRTSRSSSRDRQQTFDGDSYSSANPGRPSTAPSHKAGQLRRRSRSTPSLLKGILSFGRALGRHSSNESIRTPHGESGPESSSYQHALTSPKISISTLAPPTASASSHKRTPSTHHDSRSPRRDVGRNVSNPVISVVTPSPSSPTYEDSSLYQISQAFNEQKTRSNLGSITNPTLGDESKPKSRKILARIDLITDEDLHRATHGASIRPSPSMISPLTAGTSPMTPGRRRSPFAISAEGVSPCPVDDDEVRTHTFPSLSPPPSNRGGQQHNQRPVASAGKPLKPSGLATNAKAARRQGSLQTLSKFKYGGSPVEV